MKIDTAEHVEAAHRPDQFLKDDRPEIAFVGRSNVGKSSLMNRLLGRKGLARTSSSPGRTRAVHYFLVNRRFYFVDLPGYGYAKASKTDRASWAELIDAYFRRDRRPPLVVALVDSKVGATPLDLQAYDYLESLGAPIVVVGTKIDRLPRSKRASQIAAVRRELALGEAHPLIPVSAQSGEGTKELWKTVTAYIEAAAGSS